VPILSVLDLIPPGLELWNFSIRR